MWFSSAGETGADAIKVCACKCVYLQAREQICNVKEHMQVLWQTDEIEINY